ncbi:ribbon-helix-helix protein, CopG family [Methanoregula sp.]|uniref:ribbon-helix-helix protein, CopG family n=1 Tax=Methanoregula sp. TaxID=2052170 RepID=UPI00260AA64D|nr:ribbon-helix-helix protein, CopG family [Methanoregula sp.]MDD5144048.1 ribbon-helix-helix protein, CopG family [Methanoregula sp.]
MVKEELVFNGVKLPKSVNDKVTELAEEEGIDRSSFMRRAIIKFIESEENPELLLSQIEQILIRRPDILDEPLRRYQARDLTKRPGHRRSQ